MKKALHKDFRMEVRKSKARFLSIFFIVALGVAFFSGIQSASPDMRFSGDAYYDANNLMDIKVIGTMGLTDADVRALEAVDGVEKAEGAYASDVMLETGDAQKVIHMESLTASMNFLTAAEGRLPEKSGDCFLDSRFAETMGYELGDTIRIRQEDSELLQREQFTVTGIGSSPLYISFDRGNTTLGSGEIDGFAYILPEDFDQEVYTQIYIQAHGSKGLVSYTDAYDSLVDRITERVEGIEARQCRIRYEDVVSEAEAELEDARQELEDGKKEAGEKLADARKEIEEGEQELEDGRKDYEEGKQQLSDAEKELEDGRTELADAKAELEDGRAQLADARAQLADGYAQLGPAKEEIASGWEQINSAQAELDEGFAQLQSGREQLAAGQQQVAGTQAELLMLQEQITSGQAQLEQGKSQLDANQAVLEEQKQQLEAAIAAIPPEQQELMGPELQNQLIQVEEGLEQIAEARTELAWQETELASSRAQFEQAMAQLDEQAAALIPMEEQLQQTEAALNAGQAELDEKKQQLNAAQAEVAANEQRLASAQAEIAANEQTLADGEQEIADGERELADGEKEIEENRQKLTDAEKDIADAQKKLADGRKEYEDAEKEAEEEIADGEKEIADAQREIDDLEEPEWLVTDRGDLPEYADYGDNADRIRNIGRVFPVMFFLVAALISLTTMTRMVEEQRTQIGTMKALGYGKFAIASKYLGYALLATVGGSAAGVLIGEKILPFIIIKAYGIMYHNMSSNLRIYYELRYALIASAAAVLCTMGATLFSCYKELAETPASLMRPPAPKEGKRVLVERVTFLWRRLSFTWKSTLRNLFRYKKRLFMTIFGISGSMALLLVGYGLRDSIMDIALLQYAQLQLYDGTIILDEDASRGERGELLEALEARTDIERYTRVQMESLTATDGQRNLSVYIYVPEDLENFRQDVILRDRVTKEPRELTEAGAVVSEKTAAMMKAAAGDTITLERDNQKYQVKVTATTENYMGHYIYMTPDYYRQIFQEEPDYEAIVFTVSEAERGRKAEIGEEILTSPAALSISYTDSIAEQVERMLGSLSLVIVVLIVSAGMLAFVVLYNLNNINITERQRELATLKVLGFFDIEVSQYVFRENILLTILGIFTGAALGIPLHRFVIKTVEVDAVMFGRNIQPVSFLYCAAFTAAFSLIVNLTMHRKLKKIDMVESLKSVE